MAHIKRYGHHDARQHPCRVLMVEDSPDDLILARKNLEISEDVHEVICFSRGQALIDYIKRHDASARPALATIPTVIVVDLMMADMDGFEVLRQLKAEAPLRGVPVIVVSAAASFENINRALALKAAAFFQKPLSACDLHAVLCHGWPWPPQREV